jgi:hypothetical protein
VVGHMSWEYVIYMICQDMYGVGVDGMGSCEGTMCISNMIACSWAGHGRWGHMHGRMMAV